MILSDFGKKMSNPGKLSKIIIEAKQACRKESENVIDLSSGDPRVFTELARVWDDCAKAMVEERDIGSLLAGYGEVLGDNQLIEEVIQLFKPYDVDLTPQNILVTTGGLTCLFYIINTYAGTRNGQELNILLPQCPEYSAYGIKGLDEKQFISIKPTINILEEHVFRYDINLDELVFDNIGAIILTRPSNPSGHILSDEKLQTLITRAEQHHVPVIIDAVYASPLPDLVYKQDVNFIFNKNVIYIMSFSKAGLAGGRLGIAIGHEDLLKPLRFFQINMCITIGTFTQMLAARVLKSGQLQPILQNTIKPYYQDRLKLLKELFKQYMAPHVPYYLHSPEGGIFQWVWFKDLPITDYELYEILKSKNIFITPGSIFFYALRDSDWRHSQECIRISLNESSERIATGIKQLAEVVNKLYS